MFAHPDDLYRVQRLRHTETTGQCELERQARAASSAKRRLREIGRRAVGSLLALRWRTVLVTGHGNDPPAPAPRHPERATHGEDLQTATTASHPGQDKRR